MEVHRVNQLDSVRIDVDLFDMLTTQLQQSIPNNVLNLRALQPEVSFILRTVYFALSIGRNVPSPGNQYQNLKYKPLSIKQKWTMYIFSVGLKYISTRLTMYAERRHWNMLDFRDWRYWIVHVSKWAETCSRFFRIINIILFLRQGKYRSLEDRLAGAELEYQEQHARRSLGFELFNHALVWEGFSEFALFLWPLIQPSVLRRIFRRAFELFLSVDLGGQRRSRTTDAAGAEASSEVQLRKEREDNGTILPANLTPTSIPNYGTCKQCQKSPPTMKHFTHPCGCSYCYACIAVHMEKDDSQSDSCPECGALIEGLIREGDHTNNRSET